MQTFWPVGPAPIEGRKKSKRIFQTAFFYYYSEESVSSAQRFYLSPE